MKYDIRMVYEYNASEYLFNLYTYIPYWFRSIPPQMWLKYIINEM